jgi:hypothetical protein
LVTDFPFDSRQPFVDDNLKMIRRSGLNESDESPIFLFNRYLRRHAPQSRDLTMFDAKIEKKALEILADAVDRTVGTGLSDLPPDPRLRDIRARSTKLGAA